MSPESDHSLADPAALARCVRALASQAHRVLSDPTASPAEIRDLARRAARLQDQIGGRRLGAVARWLSSLRRELDGLRSPCAVR